MTFKERIALWFARREFRKLAISWLERALGRPLTHKEVKMLARIFGNWQTTLIGIVTGAVQLHEGGLTWQNAIKASLLALFGLAAKDAAVGSAPGDGK